MAEPDGSGGPGLDDITSDLGKYDETSKKVGNTVKNLGRGIRGLALDFALTSGAAFGAVKAFRSVITSAEKLKAAIKAAGEIEFQTTGFVALLKSVDAAKARVRELVQFAARTPFQVAGIVQASKTLEVLTRGALSTGKGLTLIGDAAALAQQPIEDMAVVIGRLYEGLKSGAPVGDVSRRLQELGLLSGAARSQIDALQASGGSFSQTWGVVEGELNRANGSMGRLSQTLQGLQSTLEDAKSQQDASIGEAFLEGEKRSVEASTKLVEAMTPVLMDANATFAKLSNTMASAKLAAADSIANWGGFRTTVQMVSQGLLALLLPALLASVGATIRVGVSLATMAVGALKAVGAFSRLGGAFGSVGGSAAKAGLALAGLLAGAAFVAQKAFALADALNRVTDEAQSMANASKTAASVLLDQAQSAKTAEERAEAYAKSLQNVADAQEALDKFNAENTRPTASVMDPLNTAGVGYDATKSTLEANVAQAALASKQVGATRVPGGRTADMEESAKARVQAEEDIRRAAEATMLAQLSTDTKRLELARQLVAAKEREAAALSEARASQATLTGNPMIEAETQLQMDRSASGSLAGTMGELNTRRDKVSGEVDDAGSTTWLAKFKELQAIEQQIVDTKAKQAELTDRIAARESEIADMKRSSDSQVLQKQQEIADAMAAGDGERVNELNDQLTALRAQLDVASAISDKAGTETQMVELGPQEGAASAQEQAAKRRLEYERFIAGLQTSGVAALESQEEAAKGMADANIRALDAQLEALNALRGALDGGTKEEKSAAQYRVNQLGAGGKNINDVQAEIDQEKITKATIDKGKEERDKERDFQKKQDVASFQANEAERGGDFTKAFDIRNKSEEVARAKELGGTPEARVQAKSEAEQRSAGRDKGAEDTKKKAEAELKIQEAIRRGNTERAAKLQEALAIEERIKELRVEGLSAEEATKQARDESGEREKGRKASKRGEMGQINSNFFDPGKKIRDARINELDSEIRGMSVDSMTSIGGNSGAGGESGGVQAVAKDILREIRQLQMPQSTAGKSGAQWDTPPFQSGMGKF